MDNDGLSHLSRRRFIVVFSLGAAAVQGTVEEVVLGTVMAYVVVRVGDNLIESAITRRRPL